jgi:hypothetical protein
MRDSSLEFNGQLTRAGDMDSPVTQMPSCSGFLPLIPRLNNPVTPAHHSHRPPEITNDRLARRFRNASCRYTPPGCKGRRSRLGLSMAARRSCGYST